MKKKKQTSAIGNETEYNFYTWKCTDKSLFVNILFCLQYALQMSCVLGKLLASFGHIASINHRAQIFKGFDPRIAKSGLVLKIYDFKI
jgi:hypothetical protein